MNTSFIVAEAATGGVSALGINWQGFLFQLITFVLVLLLLRKFVYGKLVETLEARRLAVVESLDNAQKAAKDLEATSQKTAELLKKAQMDAAEIVATAQREASKAIEDATTKATKKADHVLEQAQARIDSDIAAAREGLRGEMIDLITKATEKVLQKKIDASTDAAIIKKALEDS